MTYLSLCMVAATGCMIGGAPDPVVATLDASVGQEVVLGRGHGINVDPANHLSRPCSDLAAAHLGVTGFVRMPLKFAADDWTWANGGFDGYLACLRATLPGVAIIATLNEKSVDPTAGVPSNPYYAHHCDPGELDPAACAEFEPWLAAYLTHVSPTLLEKFDIIEVFNEPDDKWTGSGFKPGTTSSMPPRAYARLLDAFYAKFRDPIGRRIMMGGMDSGQPSYLAAMGTYRSDLVNIHPYGSYPAHVPGFAFDPANHRCTSDLGTLNPCFGSTESAIDSYQAEFAREGHTGELVISEWGSANPAMLPDLIHAFFLDPTTRATNAAFFAYSDANQAGFGLRDTTGAMKPAYAAFAHP